MAKLNKKEMQALKKELKPYFKKGSTVYTSVQKVSQSGMYRHIQVLVCYKKRIINLSYGVSKLLGWTFKDKTCSIGVSGCGMDMGFHLVYTLSSILYSGKDRAGYILDQSWI